MAEERLVDLRNGKDLSSFVMYMSFTNQLFAQIALRQQSHRYSIDIHTLPKHLDEQVALVRLKMRGAQLSQLTEESSNTSIYRSPILSNSFTININF